MKAFDISCNWLFASQDEDGTWFQVQDTECLDELKLKRHKLVYSCAVARLLSVLSEVGDCFVNLKSFVDGYDDDNVQYSVAFRALVYAYTKSEDDISRVFVKLLGAIDLGGTVNFQSKHNNRYFDDCFMLLCIIECLKACPSLIDATVKNEKFKILIDNMEHSIRSGDYSFWLWRASLLAQMRSISKESVSNLCKSNVQQKIIPVLDTILKSMRDGWIVSEKHPERSITPTIYNDEVQTAFFLYNIIVLCDADWLDESQDVLDSIARCIDNLMSQFDGMVFMARPRYRNRPREAIVDYYSAATVMYSLLCAYLSGIPRETLSNYQLTKYFEEPVNMNKGDLNSKIQALQPKSNASSPGWLGKRINLASGGTTKLKLSVGLPSILEVKIVHERELHKDK